MELLGDRVIRAPKAEMVICSAYDDWRNSIKSHTAFSRLMLILRALHESIEEARAILKPDKTVITEPGHLWPTLSDEEWAKVEIQLKDLILQMYGRKNNVNVASLTNSEIRDIILGADIAPPSQQRQQIAEIEKQAKQQTQMTETTTKSFNIHGDEIVVATQSNYEQDAFASRTDWRRRALLAGSLHQRTRNVYVTGADLEDEGTTYVLPNNILRKFVAASDLRTQIAGFLYGSSPEGSTTIKDVQYIAMPPQTGTHQNVTLPEQLPRPDPLTEGLELLGWIHTQPAEAPFLSSFDVVTHAKLMESHGSSFPRDPVVVTCSFAPGSVSLSAYTVTDEGIKWGRANRDKGGQDPTGFSGPAMCAKAQVHLSDAFRGAFLLPAEGVWNYNFMGTRFAPGEPYGLRLGNPEPFYHASHRPTHFLQFTQAAGGKSGGGGGSGSGRGPAQAAGGSDGEDSTTEEDLIAKVGRMMDTEADMEDFFA